jgi:hypothetical protein
MRVSWGPQASRNNLTTKELTENLHCCICCVCYSPILLKPAVLYGSSEDGNEIHNQFLLTVVITSLNKMVPNILCQETVYYTLTFKDCNSLFLEGMQTSSSPYFAVLAINIPI